MEKDEFLHDDFLRDLIKRSPLDSPSDDFVDRVMERVNLSPEVATAKKPFYMYLKSAIPYTLIVFLLFSVVATSDLPIFNWLPGKENLVEKISSYFGTFFTVLKNAFDSKYVAWIALISFSAGVLFAIERLFSRQTSV